MTIDTLVGFAAVLAAAGKILVDVRAGNRTTDKVKTLVDGRMTVALHTIAKLSRAVAKLTSDPHDLLIAEEAEKELQRKYDADASVR